VTLGRIPFDNEVAAFAMTELFQRFVESLYPERPGRCGELVRRNPGVNEGKAMLLPRLLRRRDQRPCGRAAGQRDDSRRFIRSPRRL
jgi:hypothetical protein